MYSSNDDTLVILYTKQTMSRSEMQLSRESHKISPATLNLVELLIYSYLYTVQFPS